MRKKSASPAPSLIAALDDTVAIKAVIFDLDGTLHDKSATLSRMAHIQFDRFSLSLSAVDHQIWLTRYIELNNKRIPKDEVFNTLASELNIEEPLKLDLLRHFDANLGTEARPFPGALELVEGCRRNGLRIGILTNGRDEFQRSKISGLGLADAVDAVVTSGGFGLKKPDLKIFRECLALLGVEPEDSAMVGDDFTADMEPAIELGMLVVWKSPEFSDQVDFGSDECSEILGYLESVV